MTDTLVLATGLTGFLLFMAWNADRLQSKDERTQASGRDRTIGEDSPSAAVTSVLRIAGQWGLDDRDLGLVLGGVMVATIAGWRRQLAADGAVQAALTRHQLDRARQVRGIHDALHRLFADAAQADRWIYQPIHMPGFEGRTAIELIRLGGMRDLDYVRRCLAGWPI